MHLPQFITNPNPQIYLSNNYLTLDLETTNLNKGDAVTEANRVVYGYWTSATGSGHLSDNEGWAELFTAIDKADFIVVQGGKFEIKWLRRKGYPIQRLLIYDTLLGEYVRAGNRRWKNDLDSISRRYGGQGKKSLVSLWIEAGVCPSELPRSLVREYCQQDVIETRRVFLLQRQMLMAESLLSVFFLRCITTPVLADIEMNGMFLDYRLVKKAHTEYVTEHNKLAQELSTITGGINMASPVQVAHFLYGEMGFEEIKNKGGQPIRGRPHKQFPEGMPLTDSDTILALKPKTLLQSRFIELKLAESKLRKQITSYTERFMDACENQGCMLYGKLNQTIAQTHRLTSSDPNLQNITRKLKKTIRARKKKWKIRSADYKQLEFRVAGMLAQDKQVLEDATSGYDVHSYTGSVLSEAGQPTARQEAKAHTFKPLNFIAVLKSGELRGTLYGQS